MENTKTLVGCQEIADYLGISRTTFWARKDPDGIPYYRIGSKILAKRSLLDEWIASGGAKGAER